MATIMTGLRQHVPINPQPMVIVLMSGTALNGQKSPPLDQRKNDTGISRNLFGSHNTSPSKMDAAEQRIGSLNGRRSNPEAPRRTVSSHRHARYHTADQCDFTVVQKKLGPPFGLPLLSPLF
jgi:hypothetical protein